MIDPKKALGQHYLCDKNIVRKICGIVKQTWAPQLSCIEIGPGTGNLTCELRDIIAPAKLTCIEIDDRFPVIDRVNWVVDDALKYDYQESDYAIGNLPYNISSQLIVRFCKHRISRWTVMVQRELAERICDARLSRIGAIVKSFFDVSTCFKVSRHVFFPPPKVESVVITAVRKQETPNFEKLDEISTDLFRFKRKMLFKVSNTRLRDCLSSIGIDLSLRPEQISIKQVLEVAKAMK